MGRCTDYRYQHNQYRIERICRNVIYLLRKISQRIVADDFNSDILMIEILALIC